MSVAEDMKRVAQEIVSSYQARISVVARLVSNTQQILEDFKTKRDEMSNHLRETLAKEESLRKKDFDNMIKDILFHQDEREEQIKDLLNTFFEEQKEIAQDLKENLTEDKKVKISDFKRMLFDIQARQKARENEVKMRVKQFQEEYKEMAESLRTLLNKGEAVQIKDFKEMVQNIRLRQIERVKEDRRRLEEISREWQDRPSQWGKLTEIMAKKTAESLKGGEIREEEEVARHNLNFT